MTMKIIHVGVGIRGSHWLQFVAEHPDFESVTCVDTDSQALAGARSQLGEKCGYFEDLSAALHKSDANAVLIASPSRFHAEHAISALSSGMAVMIEKPLAVDVAQGRKIIGAAKEHNRPVIVAENYRYWPSERTVRQWVSEGRLGEISNVTLVDRRNMPSHTEGPWLAKIEYPQLGEIAIHHFDSLRAMLLHEATSLSAHAWNPANSDYAHGACTAATLRMGDARVAYMGTLTSPRFSFSLRLEGTEGELWTNRKYVFWRLRGKRFFSYVKNVPVPPGDDKKYPKGGTTALLDSLRDATQNNVEAETSAEDNLGTLAMVEAARISDADKREVSLAEVLDDRNLAGRE
jgi:myo-inositol 2-dehydrogenase/D-chiro-inositol 1-dehydrogenase